ncbi:MAG: phosphoribosylformylglycinamidine cyclo-ligase [Methanosarcinaceae archaeon]|nr:phosphoribosylformylglycinamidine cyclo-ligase [Methanosarcinaceae archaeon]
MSKQSESATYAKSGVDIGQEVETIKSLTKHMNYKRTGLGAPMSDIGHYAGLLDFGDFAIAITTDGVGSKVLIANDMQKWDTIGIDCIAMNVNDLLAVGAEPIAFVDYLALEEHKPGFAEQIGIGLAKGAEISKMSIVGGETATLPDVIKGFDLAGTCIGIVPKDRIFTGEKIREGDVIIGLPSSGIHSNGYSLVRKVFRESPFKYQDYCPYNSRRTIGDEVLEPTRIYMEVLDVLEKCEVHGLAHITGSGLLKLRRISNLGFEIDDPIKPPEIFDFIQELGKISDEEMYKTFNMGMGFVIICPESEALLVMGITGGKRVGKIVSSGITVKGIKLE